MLGLVELTEADGVQLRRIVSDHSKADGVLQRTTSILLQRHGRKKSIYCGRAACFAALRFRLLKSLRLAKAALAPLALTHFV